MEEIGSDERTLPAGRRPPGIRAIVCGLAIVIGCGLFSAFYRAVGQAREAARDSACICNICSIKMAMLQYHDTFGQYPPRFSTDRDGRRLLSWRVHLLPYLSDETLYAKFRLDEPWDSPHNRPLLAEMPRTFACPSHREASSGFASYAAIGGPGTIFPDSGKVSNPDIKDGTDQTIAFAEVCNLDIPWTAPIDLDVRTMSFRIDDSGRPSISSRHPRGPVVVTANASYFRLRKGISPEKVRAMTTIAGGETVEPGDGVR